MWFAQCPGNSLALTVARYFWFFSDYATALCRPTLLREPSKLGSSTPASSVSLSVHGINVWNGKGGRVEWREKGAGGDYAVGEFVGLRRGRATNV